MIHNLFDNMRELASALMIDSRYSRLHRNYNDQLNELKTCAGTENDGINLLEPCDDLTTNIEVTYGRLKKTKWDPLEEYNFNVGRKSRIESQAYHDLGFKSVLKGYEGYVIDAQAAYTISVSFAVWNTPNEGLAYARRSDLWFQLSKFESCLLDANRALRNFALMDTMQPNIKDFSTLRATLLNRKPHLILKITEENARKAVLVVSRAMIMNRVLRIMRKIAMSHIFSVAASKDS